MKCLAQTLVHQRGALTSNLFEWENETTTPDEIGTNTANFNTEEADDDLYAD